MIKVKFIIMTCPACPSQWEGRIQTGEFLYIRARHGKICVEISDHWPRHDFRGTVKIYEGDSNELNTDEMISLVEEHTELDFKGAFIDRLVGFREDIESTCEEIYSW